MSPLSDDDFAKGIAELGEKLCKSQIPLDPEIASVLTPSVLWDAMTNTQSTTPSKTPQSDLLEKTRVGTQEPTSPAYLSALRLCKKLEVELERVTNLREQYSAQSVDELSNAKKLIVELHKIGTPEVRMLIEERTGPWLVFGADRFEGQKQGAPTFDATAKCSPDLTQCPRCNNPHHACDQGAAPTPSQVAVTELETQLRDALAAYAKKAGQS